LITRWLEADATQVIDAHDIVSPHLFAWRERAMRFGVRVAMLRGYGLGLSGQFVFLKLFDPAIALGDAAKRLEEIMPSVLVAWRQVLQNEQKSRAENKMRTPRIQFTPKEVELLAFIKTGKSNSEIAQILGKSETKVKTQVGTMLRKAGVPNRVALATSGH
jgi:DNA-binding NarL/FixJ family response regulator